MPPLHPSLSQVLVTPLFSVATDNVESIFQEYNTESLTAEILKTQSLFGEAFLHNVRKYVKLIYIPPGVHEIVRFIVRESACVGRGVLLTVDAPLIIATIYCQNRLCGTI